MRYFSGVTALCLFFSCLAVGCAQSQDSAQLPAKELDFNFEGLDHHTVSLVSYRDKQPVVLLFWTTWCPFCRKEIQALNAKYDNLKKAGWEILAIDAGEDARKVENYRNAHGIKLNLFLDEDMKAANSLQVLGVPTYIIINKKGRIAAEAHSFSPDEYKHLLDEK